jgi:S-adenosylmethionine-diacylglycerol 3-amino-3-carboxypropyl transferase
MEDGRMSAMSMATFRRILSVERVALPGANEDRLFFAQVREDARVELAALDVQPTDRVVVVSSGGCTALSLLGAGAREVHAVDVNRAQNHLVELKAAAVVAFARETAIGFLGGQPMAANRRTALYRVLRPRLTDDARDYWDARTADIATGVINAGVSERFIRLVCWFVRHVVQTPARVERLLACRTLQEQRLLFRDEWNNWRWRWLFAALLNKWSMSRAYDPRFFANAGQTSFAAHFRALADHVLTEIPIADNYFMHHMLSGRYPVEEPDGVPPYLGEDAYNMIAEASGSLLLVDGSVTEHLRTLPDGSVNAFALSNICEWLSADGITALFREVERTAAPAARVVFRNFVGWTDLPSECARIQADPELGDALIRADRSAVQPRVVVCRVRDR